MSKKKQGAELDINVEFGGVSIGESTCRLGVRIARSVLNLLAADECFCGHRLTGKVILGQRDDQPGQGKLIDDTDYEVEGSFDVKRIGVNADTITTGLTFSLADIEVADIAKFSKGTGRLVVYEIGELPVDAPDEHDDDDAGIPPGTLRSEGPWRDVELKTLFKGVILKSLNGAKLKTLGDLSDYTATGENRLEDLDGLGPGRAETVSDTMVAFFRDNPQHAEPANA